jgi:hypothetical protein
VAPILLLNGRDIGRIERILSSKERERGRDDIFLKLRMILIPLKYQSVLMR